MKEDYCNNLTNNLPFYCQKKIWKSAGCTANPPENILQNKKPKEIFRLADKLSKSKNISDWKLCFGNNTNNGYGSTNSYNSKEFCPKLSDEGEVIACNDCDKFGGRDEGIWFYKNGRRVNIPSCQCRSTYMSMDKEPISKNNYDVCGDDITTSKTISNKILNDCEVYKDINNGEDLYYQGKGIVDGINDNSTIFYSPNDSNELHTLQKCIIECNGNKINICEKVKSCQDNTEECQNISQYQIENKNKPKIIDAKCWYSIPVTSDLGEKFNYYIGNKPFQLEALNCKRSLLFNEKYIDAVLFLANVKNDKTISKYNNNVFIFKSNLCYLFKITDNRFKLENNYPRPITDIFPKLLFPIKCCYFNTNDGYTYFFYEKEYIKYDINKGVIEGIGEISELVKGIPLDFDTATHIGGVNLFFKDNLVYEVKEPKLLLKPKLVEVHSMVICEKTSGKVLEISQKNPNDTENDNLLGSSLILGDYNSKNTLQYWFFDPITKNIINSNTGYCINNDLQLVERSGILSQQWEISNGEIQSLDPGKPFYLSITDTSNLIISKSNTIANWSAPFGFNINDYNNTRVSFNYDGNIQYLTIGEKESIDKPINLPSHPERYSELDSQDISFILSKNEDEAKQMCNDFGWEFLGEKVNGKYSYEQSCKKNNLKKKSNKQKSSSSSDEAEALGIGLLLGGPLGAGLGEGIFEGVQGLKNVFHKKPRKKYYCKKPKTPLCYKYQNDRQSMVFLKESGECGDKCARSRCENLGWKDFTKNGTTYTCKNPNPCDWKCYLDRYPDLKITSESKASPIQWAKTQWKKHGKKELKNCSCDTWRKVAGIPITIQPDYQDIKDKARQWWIYDPIKKHFINPTSGFIITLSSTKKNKMFLITEKISSIYKVRKSTQQWNFNNNSISLSISPSYSIGICNKNKCFDNINIGKKNLILLESNNENCIIVNNINFRPDIPQRGYIGLYSAIPNNIVYHLKDLSEPKKFMEMADASCKNFENAKDIALALGGRIASSNEVLINRLYLKTQKKVSYPGWCSDTINRNEGCCILDITTNLDNQEMGGVWCFLKNPNIRFKGNVTCGGPAINTTNPNNCIIERGCVTFSEDSNKIKSNCHNPIFSDIELVPKNIKNNFTGLPYYLDSVFYDNNKIYGIKEDKIFISPIHLNTSENSQNSVSDNIPNTNNDLNDIQPIYTYFLNFPKQIEINKFTNHSLYKDEKEHNDFFYKNLEKILRDLIIVERGKEAIQTSDLLLKNNGDKANIFKTQNKNLDTSLLSLTRQSNISENDNEKRDAYLHYLFISLTFLLIEIVCFSILKNTKIGKIGLIIPFIVFIIFIIYLVPRLRKDFTRSKQRWSLFDWKSLIIFPSERQSQSQDEKHISQDRKIKKMCKTKGILGSIGDKIEEGVLYTANEIKKGERVIGKDIKKGYNYLKNKEKKISNSVSSDFKKGTQYLENIGENIGHSISSDFKKGVQKTDEIGHSISSDFKKGVQKTDEIGHSISSDFKKGVQKTDEIGHSIYSDFKKGVQKTDEIGHSIYSDFKKGTH